MSRSCHHHGQYKPCFYAKYKGLLDVVLLPTVRYTEILTIKLHSYPVALQPYRALADRAAAAGQRS